MIEDLLVQKYGGSSVATAQRIAAVAERILEGVRAGRRLVVVVSAMGKTTDELLRMAQTVSDGPDERELDLLLSTGETVSATLMAMAIRGRGAPALSLNAGQAGIRTDSRYGHARIQAVDTGRLQRELQAGKVVVVTGFQGVTDEFDVTTLGRGGSDTTAVALACALGAQVCEIYTDVEGVYTADPRLVPGARKLTSISYEEMLELAQQGAKVMHPRSVELGDAYGLPIVVRSSFNRAPGTLITKGESMENWNRVRGIAHDLDVAKVSFAGVPDRPGIAASIFLPLAEAGISVDTIVQTSSMDGITDISFTVSGRDLNKTVTLMQATKENIGARTLDSSSGLGKVSIVGVGMQTAHGIAAQMFSTLAEAGVNINMITTSEIRITCIIDRDKVEMAVRALHDAFELERAEG